MKVRVIGNKGCSRCEITKKLLTENNVEFEYCVLADMRKQELETVLNKAKDKNLLALPIIEVDGELKLNVQEVLQLCK